MAVAVIEATNSEVIYRESQVIGGLYESYSTVHDSAIGTDLQGGLISFGQAHRYNIESFPPAYGDYFFIGRAGFVFDLSSLPSGAIIAAATLSLYGMSDYSDTADFNITIVSGVDLGNTFVIADYGDLLNDTTSFGALTTVGFLLENWNIITLNATGVAAVQAALANGVIRFGLRSSRDISSTTPKIDPNYNDEYVNFYSHSTANKKPKLTITYSAGEEAGVITIKGTAFRYVDAFGAERGATLPLV